MLKLVVCVKQVPRVTELPWDEKTGTLRRELAAGMMNPACKHALEAALQIKEYLSATVTVITMGPPAAEEVLREALALGADRAILICDQLLAGSDTFATSLVLKEAIKKKCPKFDLILCGTYTADSETAQVGPQLAEELDLPAAAYVEKLEILAIHYGCVVWWTISVKPWRWSFLRWLRFLWKITSRAIQALPVCEMLSKKKILQF